MASLYSALVLYHPPNKKKKKKKSKNIKRTRAVVNKLVKALHHAKFKLNVGIEVAEVFQGGSLGQGTAIPGHYDVDLVLYSRSINYTEAVENEGFSDTLNRIDRYFSRTFASKYTLQEVSAVAVKFRYLMDNGKTIDVDLLLSPYWDTLSEQLSAMRTVHPPLKRLIFSASTSRWQTEFIQHQNMHVKELIRRAKAWRNMVWAGNKDGRPKSYLLSLLVITAYHRTPGASIGYRLKSYAHSVTAELKQLVRSIVSNKDLDLSIPGAKEDLRLTYADLLPDKPCIVDPVNPSNNVYLSGVGPVTYGPGDGKWDIFVRRVGTIDLSINAEAIMRRIG